MNKIKKVKLEANKIRIEYLVPVQNADNPDDDEHSFLCAQRARPSFYDALESLTPFVAEICEQSKDWAGTLEVKGVSFSYSNDIMGACITALKTLEKSNSPLVINTPHKPSEPYSESGDEAMCLSDDATAALWHLQDEARAYLDGHRAQLSMNFDGEDAAQEHEEDSLNEAVARISELADVTVTHAAILPVTPDDATPSAPKKRGRPRKNLDAVAVAAQ